VIIWHSFFFLMFALIACTAAIAMVVTNNVVRMAFYLVISLAAVAGLYFLAGADFVGAMQLMIYVGGTLVLLIFGVMLTAQRPFVTMKTNPGEVLWATIIGAFLLGILLWAAFSVDDWTASKVAQAGAKVESRHTVTRLGLGLLGVRVDELDRPAEPVRPSSSKPTGSGLAGYLLPFEIVSVHLLVVLIGAAYLARTRKHRRKPIN
jgi:NADH:ubiquinone oxidoreductase subunit 6 (subunit J)